MTAESNYSVRKSNQLQSDLLVHIGRESEVKSLDRIKTLRSKHSAVHAPRTRRDLSESDNALHLRTSLLRAQYAQTSVMTSKVATSTRSNAGSKKVVGVENISSRTAT